MIPEPTILILDEDASSRQVLMARVRALRFPVEACASREEVQKVYNPSRPGCLVYHLRRPGTQGLETFMQLRRQCAELPVIVVSAERDVPIAVAAMKAGAELFLEKPCCQSALEKAITEALQIQATQRQKLLLRAKIHRRLEKLTAGEYAVLELIVLGRSNHQAAEQLELSVRTIEVRRAKIMEKMRARSFAELICMTLYAEPKLTPYKYQL